MTAEQFKPQDYLPQGYYPWPDLLNPNIAQMGKDMAGWVDQYLAFLPEKGRQKYKRMRLEYAAGRMIAGAQNYERVKPCNRYMLFLTAFDDQHELCGEEELEFARKKVVAVLQGVEPQPDDIGLYHLLAKLRDEYAAFMSTEWMERFTEDTSRFIRYGMGGEAPYKISQTIPTLAQYVLFREYSIGMYPHTQWVDVDIDFILPDYLASHPVILRLRALNARIESWQNDIHSLPKEQEKESEVLNLVFVLQQEYNISFEEAMKETMKIHDADVAEFEALRKTLPDFGIHQGKIEEYVLGLGIQLQGLNTFYITDTERYLPGGAGFAWPEKEIADKNRA